MPCPAAGGFSSSVVAADPIAGSRRQTLLCISPPMRFDDQLLRYFGTTELGDIDPAAIGAGVEHMRVDLGLEKDRDRRFALWALLHMLGGAPDLDVAFKDEADRNAARNFMDMLAAADLEA
jgi:hypothetical protein